MTATELRDLARRIRSPEFDWVRPFSTNGKDHDCSQETEVEVSMSDLFTDYEIGLICDALNKSADVIDAERAVARFLSS